MKDSNGVPTADAIEIEVVNNMKVPLITVGCTTGSCSATDVVQTLLPTATDSLLMTANSNGPFSPSTWFKIGFVIGSSQSTTIEVGLEFAYTDQGNPGPWSVSANIDGGGNAFTPVTTLQLLGAQFVANATSGYPSFSMYVSPTETASGKMTLTFYGTQGN